MKKTVATLLGLCFTVLTYAQANTPEKLIALGKAYKDFMFNSEPAKDVLKDLKKNMPAPLKAVTDFTIHTITTNNKLLTSQFLSRPDDQVLKQVFIVSAIFDNINKEDQVDNKRLIDSLTLKDIPVYELVDNYYGMLFTAVGNKNQP